MPNHPDIGACMNNLAYVLQSLNNYKDSAVLYRDALNFCKANLLPNNPLIGTTMDNLACSL
jgi:hypothetical protein